MPKRKRLVRLLNGLALYCLLASALTVRAQTTPSPQTISITVINKQNQRVSVPLRKEDVRLMVDGEPQEITSLEAAKEQPFSLVLMMDTSMSQELVLPSAKAAADEFLSSVARTTDSIGVVSFTGEAEIKQAPTGDLAAARRALGEIQIVFPQGYQKGMYKTGPISPKDTRSMAGTTAIWDAVIFACEKMLNDSQQSRRGILLFSDGMDTSSRASLSKAVEAASRAGVAIFIIGIGNDELGGVDEDTLRKVAERTGGSLFTPKKVGPLREALAAVGEDLRSPLTLTFSPTNTTRRDSLHKIKLELVNPELRKRGLRLSYRQGYFAR
jgi:VWFA-related protein